MGPPPPASVFVRVRCYARFAVPIGALGPCSCSWRASTLPLAPALVVRSWHFFFFRRCVYSVRSTYPYMYSRTRGDGSTILRTTTTTGESTGRSPHCSTCYSVQPVVVFVYQVPGDVWGRHKAHEQMIGTHTTARRFHGTSCSAECNFFADLMVRVRDVCGPVAVVCCDAVFISCWPRQESPRVHLLPSPTKC